MNVGGFTIPKKIVDFVENFVKQLGSAGTSVSAQSILDSSKKNSDSNDNNEDK